MKNAFEYEVELNERGKPFKKRIAIGPVLVWGIIAFTTLLLGKTLIPASFWEFFKR